MRFRFMSLVTFVAVANCQTQAGAMPGLTVASGIGFEQSSNPPDACDIGIRFELAKVPSPVPEEAGKRLDIRVENTFRGPCPILMDLGPARTYRITNVVVNWHAKIYTGRSSDGQQIQLYDLRREQRMISCGQQHVCMLIHLRQRFICTAAR